MDLSPSTDPSTATIFSRSTDAGTGVRAGTACRLHDQFVEMRARQEHGTDGALKQSPAVLGQIETAVNETSDTGLASQLSRFTSAWVDVAHRPDDLSARQQLVELGKTPSADFAHLDGSLAALGQNTGRQLDSTVADINNAAATVAILNNRVLAAVNADMPADDLMDQRDVMVRNLADLAGVTVRPQENGVVDVYLGTIALVRGNRAEALRVDVTTTPGTIAVVEDQLGVSAAAGSQLSSLQGAVNSTIAAYPAQLTAVQPVAAQSLVTEQVDSAHEATSGVNIDEEMTNLVAIQHAFDASARFITGVESMLETLIRRSGPVGR